LGRVGSVAALSAQALEASKVQVEGVTDPLRMPESLSIDRTPIDVGVLDAWREARVGRMN
jgi:hypothetical protein